MGSLAVTLWLLVGVGRTEAETVQSSRHSGEYLHEVRTEVETPHTKWLKPNAAGKPTILFLARRPGILPRRIVEVWQRMDLDYAAFTYAPDQNERDYWESNLAGSRTPEKRDEAVRALSNIYDGIVLLGFDTNWLPTQAKYWLLRQVKGGCALVAVDSGLPFKAAPDEAGLAAITTGIPFSVLPGYSSEQSLKAFAAKSWKDVPARAVQTGTFGRGRTVSMRFSSFGVDPEDEIYSDYHHALVVKALQWAIPKIAPATRFASLPEGTQTDREALTKGDFKPTLTLQTDAETKLSLEVTFRHPLLGEESRYEEPVALKPGDNTLSLKVPALPAGHHFCDIRLRSDAGVVNFASFGFTVNASETIAELTLDKPFVAASDSEAVYQVRLAEPLKAEAALRILVTDTYGRVVADSTTPLKAGEQQLAGKIPLSLVVAMAHWVRAELRRDKDILDARSALLIVRRPGPPEYPALLWGGCEGGLDGLRQLRRQRETGFNICLTGVSADGSSARFVALADMQLCIYATHISGVSDGKNGKVSNPEAMEKWTGDVAEKCRASAPYGVYVYSLGDECYSGGYRQPLAPSDVAAYREFLNGRYHGLEDLNRVWRTAYRSFDEIEPVDWEKASSDPGNYPQLHERASFVEHLYAKAMHEHDRTLSIMDPDAKVGAEGSEPGDLELTLDGLEMWGPYTNRRIDVLLHSLAPRELVRGMWWGGYHSGFFERSTSVRQLWRQVFEGVCNTNYFFDGHMGHHESNCASDLSWAEYFRKMLPDLRQIYEGPGPLLSAATHLDFGVAFHWSQASEHASLFYAPFGTSEVECNAVFGPFDQSGVNYHFVTTRKIERKELDAKKVKLLVLPLSTAISDLESKEMESYVSAGGILLASGSTGQMDGHCALVEAGQLDKVLGLKRTGKPNLASQKVSGKGQLFGETLECSGLEIRLDALLRTDGAQIVLGVGEVPVLTVRTVGKGKAVFFNGAFSELSSKGEEGAALTARAFRALMKEAGIEPLLGIEPRGSARAYTFSLGTDVLVSFIGKEPGNATIRLTRKAHVYDCLNGKHIGEQDTISRTEQDGLFGLYCLASGKSREPQLDAPREASRGGVMRVRVSLPKGEGRILRLDPYRPDGTWVRTLRRFIRLPDTQAEAAIPFALNEPAGVWTLTLTDLATGMTATAKVALK